MDLQSKEQRNCFDVCNIDLRPSGERLPIPHRSLQEIDEDGLTAEELRSKKKEMDEILAQTLSGLTFEERQQHQEILHGVDEGTAEEASFVDDKLAELDLHLMQIKGGSMYEVAERQDSEFVNDRAFRIMFLRANEYDPRAAADQMIRFFESKCELFGESKLTKHITMKDLDADDIAALESGWLQHIGMDQSGRQIWLHAAGVAPYGCGAKALMSCLRAQYFFGMKMLQSEQTQLRGQITIWYIVGSFKNRTSVGYKEQYAAANCIPRKTAAVHLCVDDLYQYALTHDLVKLMKRNVIARFRVHFGSQLECQYQLATFGVSPSALPIDDRGGLDLTQHRKWIQACAEENNIPYSPSSVSSGTLSQNGTKPNQNDVLFHNGRSSGYHIGNKRFRGFIQDHSQAYTDSRTDEAKRQIVATVIGKVYASGGRFLKQRRVDSLSAWEEVPPTELRQKIMQSFRNRRRLAAAGSNQAANESIGVVIAGNPLPNDVIFGRTSQRNPGNELLNRLIKENFKDYDSLDRGKKKMVVESIVQQVKERNCRFVQVDPKTWRWIQVSDDNARERISKSFRNLRRYDSSKKAK